jgi:Tol biopolymer transport system component
MSRQPDSQRDEVGQNGKSQHEPQLDSALADFTDRLLSDRAEDLPPVSNDPELRHLQETVARLERAFGRSLPEQAVSRRILGNLVREFRRRRPEPSSYWRRRLSPTVAGAPPKGGWRSGRQRRRLTALGLATLMVLPLLFLIVVLQYGGRNLLGTLLPEPSQTGYPGPAASVATTMPLSAQAGITTRISISTAGVEGDHNSWSSAISADGRYVVFVSLSGNLDPGGDDQVSDIYRYDLRQGELRRISRSFDGGAANGHSYHPAVSADGRFVAFTSLADNLVPGDLNGAADIFLYDTVSDVTERVSLGAGSQEADGASRNPALSADGRYVAFRSDAGNLAPGAVHNSHIYLTDRLAGTMERVSVNAAGEPGNDDSYRPAVSADGRFIAFSSRATNLVPDDTNSAEDIFLRDRSLESTVRVSVGQQGAQADGHSTEPAISADGRFVAFRSQASNLVAGDTNGVADVFVYDRLAGSIERISAGSLGEQANQNSGQPAISADGNIVALVSAATNLAPGTWQGYLAVFTHERQTGITSRVSSNRQGDEGNGASANPSLSADGRLVTFDSVASNLVRTDHNQRVDVFLHDRLPATHLALDQVVVQAGATLLLSGSHFTPDEVATVSINEHQLGSWLTGQDGSFVLALMTTEADPGAYYVVVQVNQTRQVVHFRLLPGSVTGAPATAPVLQVPPGIALGHFVYLPLTVR